MTVHLKDGTTLEGATDINRGDTEDPYGPEELTAKFHEMIEPQLGEAAASALLERCLALPEVAEVRDLLAPFGAVTR